MEFKDWREFFAENGNYYTCTERLPVDNVTFEELYQHFKARLMEENGLLPYPECLGYTPIGEKSMLLIKEDKEG